jgi:Xaa-Pro dipeptidase
MRRAMEAERLDALLLRLPENVLLLSGYWPMTGSAVLLFPRESKPLLVLPECFEAETAGALWDAEKALYRYGLLSSPDPAVAVADSIKGYAAGKNWRRIGWDGGFEAMAPSWQSAEILLAAPCWLEMYREAFAGCELIDASALIQAERQVKNAWEIEQLRIAGEISAVGLEVFERSVAPGISGIELVAIVEREIMIKGAGYKGAQRVRGYAQVATGPEETSIAYRMHEIFSPRPMREGEIAVLELGVVADGYWADRTRVRVAGSATDEQHKVFDTVLRAQTAAKDAIRPGVTGAEVDETARSLIRDAGYAEFFPHITGHGLGFAYHEAAPKLAPGASNLLAEGMVTSVEPGIYFKGFGGMRIEDDVVVTADGAETLGPFRNLLSGPPVHF